MGNGKFPLAVGILQIFLFFHSGVSFSVKPNGLTGSSQRTGKVGQYQRTGISWSRNLDSEIKLRKYLCPQVSANQGYQYRYHNATQSCYKVGTIGPCGENMAFFAFPTDAVYGDCECNNNDHARALIMDPSGKRCHFVYSRGYCSVGEWLVFNPTTWEPTCESNKCLRFYEHVNLSNNFVNPGESRTLGKAVSVEFVPYKGSCAPLGLSCEAKDVDEASLPHWASLSHTPHEIQFVKGKMAARCVPKDFAGWRYPIPKMQCVPGSSMYFREKALKGSVLEPCLDHGFEE